MPSFPFPLYASPRSHSTRSALGNICIQIPHPKRCRGKNDDDAGFSREFGCMGSWAGDPQASSYRVVIASTVTILSAEPRITVCTILVVSVGTTAAYAIIKTFFYMGSIYVERGSSMATNTVSATVTCFSFSFAVLACLIRFPIHTPLCVRR